jgi:hypothetical protein
MSISKKELLTRRDFLEKIWKYSLRWGTISCPLHLLYKTASAYAEKKAEILQEARHYEKLSGKRVKCYLCFRGCEILDWKEERA